MILVFKYDEKKKNNRHYSTRVCGQNEQHQQTFQGECTKKSQLKTYKHAQHKLIINILDHLL